MWCPNHIPGGELLTEVDRHVPVDHQLVAVQEYGERNVSLIAGLEARGARVVAVPVYRWDFPADLSPLSQAVREMADGQADVVLFTSAIQIEHVRRWRAAWARGPLADRSAADGCRLHRADHERGVATVDWPVDVEPEHAKMGHLVL